MLLPLCQLLGEAHRESPPPSFLLARSHNWLVWCCPSRGAVSLLPRSFWRSPWLAPVLLASKTLQGHLCYCRFFLSLTAFLVCVPNIEALENFRVSLKHLCCHQWGRAMVAVVRWQVVLGFFGSGEQFPLDCAYFVIVLVQYSTCQGCLTRRTCQSNPVLLTKEGNESTSALKSLKDRGF